MSGIEATRKLVEAGKAKAQFAKQYAALLQKLREAKASGIDMSADVNDIVEALEKMKLTGNPNKEGAAAQSVPSPLPSTIVSAAQTVPSNVVVGPPSASAIAANGAVPVVAESTGEAPAKDGTPMDVDVQGASVHAANAEQANLDSPIATTTDPITTAAKAPDAPQENKTECEEEIASLVAKMKNSGLDAKATDRLRQLVDQYAPVSKQAAAVDTALLLKDVMTNEHTNKNHKLRLTGGFKSTLAGSTELGGYRRGT